MESQDEDLDLYFPDLRLGKVYEGAEEKVLNYFKAQFATIALLERFIRGLLMR